MLLRGTKSVATLAELASSTSTGSVGCGDCAPTKFGRTRQAKIIKFAAADGNRPIAGLRMVFMSNPRYLAGISISKTWPPAAHQLQWYFIATLGKSVVSS